MWHIFVVIRPLVIFYPFLCILCTNLYLRNKLINTDLVTKSYAVSSALAQCQPEHVAAAADDDDDNAHHYHYDNETAAQAKSSYYCSYLCLILRSHSRHVTTQMMMTMTMDCCCHGDVWRHRDAELWLVDDAWRHRNAQRWLAGDVWRHRDAVGWLADGVEWQPIRCRREFDCKNSNFSAMLTRKQQTKHKINLFVGLSFATFLVCPRLVPPVVVSPRGWVAPA